MLLDPLEEQLHLPAAAIELGDRECRQREVVGEEHQCLAFVGLEPDASQRFGVAGLGVEHRQGYRLIADQSRGAVHTTRIATHGLEVGLGACHEECARQVQSMQPLEIR